MKRLSSTNDSDSDSEIWNYTTSKNHKHVKNKQLVGGSKLHKSYKVKQETALENKLDRSKSSEQQTVLANRCPSCQVPFQLIGDSLRLRHVDSCLEITSSLDEECPDGEQCKSDNIQHYVLYKHDLLAKVVSRVQKDDSQAESCLRAFSLNEDVFSSSSIDQTGEPCLNTKMGFSVETKCPSHFINCENILSSSSTMEAPNDAAVRPKEIESAFLSSDLITEFQTDFFDDSNCDLTVVPSSRQAAGADVTQDSAEPNFVSTKHHKFVKQKQGLNASQQKTLPANQRSILSFFAPKSAKLNASVNNVDKSHVNSDNSPCTHDSSNQTLSGSSDNVVNGTKAAGASGQLCEIKSAPSITERGKGTAWLSTSFPSTHSSTASVIACDITPVAQSHDRSYSKVRNCPFYKRIPGTSFTVDAFSYGTIPDCTGYFLSHFHADHYYGLTRKFKHTLYCSQVTANLLILKIKIDQSCVKILPMGTPQMIEGVNVTLLNANHCPGSVMFLFKLKRFGKEEIFLHTGDFRADRSLKFYPEFQSVCIDQLFLDTTYCNPTYSFPPQREVIEFAVHTALEVVKSHPKTLVVVGTYTIGKERVFQAIAEALESKIYVKLEKKRILDCLEDANLSERLTLSRNDARVHVVKMNQLNVQELTSYLDLFKSTFDHLLAIEPTGWTHSNKTLSMSNIRPKFSSSKLTIYGIPYSEHSSYEELKEFIQFLRPRKIVPTVNNGDAKSRQKMNELFQAWMSMPLSKGPVHRQHALNDWIKK